MQQHRDDLQRIESEYGVDKEVIVAIILVETGLGQTLGTRSILNTLSSLAALEDTTLRNELWQSPPPGLAPMGSAPGSAAGAPR